jgi:DNA repair protein RadC
MHTYKSHAVTYRLVKERNNNYHQARIRTSREAAEFIRPLYGDNMGIFEEFHLILLNQANNTIGNVRIGQGGITSTLVDVKLIAKYAIESLATHVILSHNHPSGQLMPSEADKQMTRKVIEGLKILDVRVTDHIIMTEDSFYSFADEGVL